MKTSILQNILLVAAGGLAAGLANGEAETPDYGNYVCLVQRIVGFEGGFKDKPPYAGKILPEEQASFLMKISKINNDRPWWCFPAKIGGKVTDFHSLAPDEYTYWWKCKTTSELTISSDMYPSPMRGDSLNLFRGEQHNYPIFAWFHISEGLKYKYGNTYLIGDLYSYLEEGVCQKK